MSKEGTKQTWEFLQHVSPSSGPFSLTLHEFFTRRRSQGPVQQNLSMSNVMVMAEAECAKKISCHAAFPYNCSLLESHSP